MSGFHILTPSWTSGATITANSEASALVGAANLLFVQPSRKWRSAGLGTLRLTINAGSAKAWDSVALLRHNGFNGTIQLFAGSNSGTLFSAPNYRSTVKYLRFPGDLSSFTQYDTWLYEGSIRTHQYIGLEILDASNPDGYFQAGVVMVGVKFEPRIGPDLGSASGRDDPSSMIRLLNGEAIVRPKRGMDVGSFTFPMQPPSDTTRWREINRVYGSKIPIVCKWDPNPPTDQTEQHTFFYGYAMWRSGGPITYSNGHGFNDVELNIEEV